MGAEELNHKAKSETRTNDIWNDILEHLTTAAHVFVFGIGILLLYLCFVGNLNLVQWHVLLSTFGWLILMTEGIFAMTIRNVFSKRLRHLHRVRFHWLVELFAVALTVAGFVCIFVDREQAGSEHFTRAHGLYGLVATILALVAVANGCLAAYSTELKRFIRPNVNKVFHSLVGMLAFAFGCVSILYLFQYSNRWFAVRTDDNQYLRWFCFWGLLVCFVWVLVLPLVNLVGRVRVIFA